MMLKWIDKKSSLKAGKKLYLAGDIVPAYLIPEKRINLFKELKMIKSVFTESELAKIKVEAERVEAERVEAERVEAERVEAERVEAERVEAERVEAERVEAEKKIKKKGEKDEHK